MKKTYPARICVPICERNAKDLAQAAARAAELAEIIELRLDCLEENQFSAVERELAVLFPERSRPFIFTLRSAEQGGRHVLDRKKLFDFWSSEINGLLKANEDFADVELEMALALIEAKRPVMALDWDRIICSHHDFSGVPADLEKIFEQMAGTPARILKIAVRADDVMDCIPVFRLLDRAHHEGREMIAIAMGPAGAATRILGPARGGFLTYGSSDEAHATAPGQITAAALRDLYRVHKLDRETKIMGLVGQPVAHSVSPHIHNAAFAACDLNAVYIPFEVRDPHQFIRRMVHPRSSELDWRLRGLSITAPHKSAIIEHLDWIEPSARQIGAVNTVVIEEDALRGYNTDALALLTPLRDKLGTLRDTRIAIIGAGGAARSALWALQREGARLTVFARLRERARSLAEEFGALYERLDGARFDDFDLVINATPLGTRGHSEDETPAVADQLRGARVAFDLVYNPPFTRFRREAHEAGCESIGGLAMLVAQAAEQFSLWTGEMAPFHVMHEAAVRALDEQMQVSAKRD
ncbi:MAG TPA: shikimate dehydrogenase [Pyrinomonadaceae bacterium]|nr:shikimate dehydrogenase [Pyrinomonadaceae bacterium]